MYKKLFFIFSIFLTIFLIFFISSTAFFADAPQLELDVKKVERVSDEEIMIQYGVINRRDFDCFNVSIAFKVLSGETPVACKEIKETIPKGADGTEIKEVKIKVHAGTTDLNVKSTIFFSTKRYRIENWFSGCKDF
jgi:hypothetical protein